LFSGCLRGWGDLKTEGGSTSPEGRDAALSLLFLVTLLPLIDEGFPRVSMKFTLRASLWATAVLARGLSIRAHSRR
jgi:hypothetical protein